MKTIEKYIILPCAIFGVAALLQSCAAESPFGEVGEGTLSISNPLINFFDEMQIKDGFDRMVATTPGVQVGMVTYHGKLVDKLIGSYTSLPSIDIRVMLSETN